ncbi:uncharacterized protein DUF4214 [Humitalea rosea]|uniref:Uncharacterized protein DUF4214 n=1 Tax=Humitalea rosea TaxID=990373 RepID=A0A2W7IMM1_9PROT|nr:DUF4214 domain-containing protein [Humitalea rosea]PZW48435.1 uncharacterized protein DUF4214 [Humitalea rosea]
MGLPSADVVPTDAVSGILQPFTGIQRVDAVLTGLKWNTLELTYSFPSEISAWDFATPWTAYTLDTPIAATPGAFVAANAAIQAAVPVILAEQFSAVSGLRFTQASDANDLDTTIKIAQFTSGPDLSDVAFFPWLNDYRVEAVLLEDSFRGNARNPLLGNYDWSTLIHEIGHSLGLKHPHQLSAPSEGYAYIPLNLNRAPAERNSVEFTVMTYAVAIGSESSGAGISEPWGEPQSLMQDDIQALQTMYGANYAHQAGNTVYSFNPATGEMSIDGVPQGRPGGDDAPPQANRIFRTIWDGGGEDTYDLSNYAGIPDGFTDLDLSPGGWLSFSPAQTANLGGGSLASAFPIWARGNVASALLFEDDPRGLIENLRGTQGNDLIRGNAAGNLLAGNGGSDLIRGLGGNDRLDGGAGENFLDGGDGFDIALFSSLGHRGWLATIEPDGNTKLSLGERSDTLLSIEAAAFADGRLSFAADGAAALAAKLYALALGRAPEAHGLDMAIDAVAAGAQGLAASLLGSAEFAALGPLSDHQFIDRLYLNLRGEAGDATGTAYWLDELGHTGRDHLLVDFAATQEAAAEIAPLLRLGLWDADAAGTTLARAYHALLGRAPDLDGFLGWGSAIAQGGLALDRVFDAILASDEAAPRFGGTDDAVFVEHLYTTALGRAADAEGLGFWTTLLGEARIDRAGVAEMVAASQEFATLTDALIYGGGGAEAGVAFA